MPAWRRMRSQQTWRLRKPWRKNDGCLSGRVTQSSRCSCNPAETGALLQMAWTDNEGDCEEKCKSKNLHICQCIWGRPVTLLLGHAQWKEQLGQEK